MARISGIPSLVRAVQLAITVIASAWVTQAAASDGQFDPTFGTQGREAFPLSSAATDSVLTIVEVANGRLLIAAACDELLCFARLKPDGDFDTTFGPTGLGYVRPGDLGSDVINTHPLDMTVLPDGRIAFLTLVGSDAKILVILPDGSALDPSVGSGAGYIDHVLGQYDITACGCRIATQADGKIVIAFAASVSSGTAMVVARLNANLDGLDASFGSGGVQTIAFGIEGPGGGENDFVQAVAVQADGKIVVAGHATLSDNSEELEFARLLPTGARDSSFGPNEDGRFVYANASGQSRDVANIAIDSANRIVFGGSVTTGADSEAMVGRLTTLGAMDLTFAGTGFYEFLPINTTGANKVHSVAVTADSIFAGSQIPQTSGDTNFYFAVTRFNMNGIPSAAFGSGGTSYASFSTSSISDTNLNVLVTHLGIVVAGSEKITGAGTQAGIGRLQYEHIFEDKFE